MKYFVWMKGQKDSFAQIWYRLPTNGSGKTTVQALFVKTLEPDQYKLSLNELAELYKDKKDG